MITSTLSVHLNTKLQHKVFYGKIRKKYSRIINENTTYLEKYGHEVMKLFSCSTELSMKF